jgi:hypothetical protein
VNVQERLGRRKEEARAGLEAARGRTEDFTGRLAALIAGLAKGGADKLTILPSAQLEAIAPFVEKLLDRVVVVAGEPVGKKSDYAVDRFFVSTALSSEQHDVTSLAEAGHPVVQWKVEPGELDAEYARWRTIKTLLDELLPAKPPVAATPMPAEPALRANGLALFAPPEHAYVLRRSAGMLGAEAAASPASWIAAQLALADPGDHVVLATWLSRPIEELSPLQGAIRNVTKLACTRSVGHVRSDARGIFLILTDQDVETALPAGRALRVHTEDADPARIVESLRDAVKMLSRK